MRAKGFITAITAIVVALPHGAFAQSVKSECRAVEADKPVERIAAGPGDIAPRGYERTARAIKPFLQIIDNRDFLFDSKTDEVLDNPDATLKRFGFTVSPGSFWRSPEDVERGWTNLATFHDSVKKVLVEEDDAPLDLARGRGWGLTQKLFSSVTASIAFSERPFAVGRTPETERDKNARTLSLTFDPSLLLFDGAARKSGLAALNAYLKIAPELTDMAGGMWKSHVCTASSSVSECLRRFSPDTSRSSNLLWLLPSFTIQSVDEFDFILRGGTLILPQEGFREGTTENYLFTWDLSKLVNSASANRAAAIAGLKIYRDMLDARSKLEAAKTPFALKVASLRPFTPGVVYYGRLQANKEGNYTFEAEQQDGELKGFAGVELHPDGVLLGVPKSCGASGATGAGCSFDVTVKTGDTKAAVCTVTIPAK